MIKGKVTSYNPTKGYGFILGDDGKEYFAHVSKVVVRLEERLYVNEHVQFQILKKTPQYKCDEAINIQPLIELDVDETYQIVLNPFTRFPINEPSKFTGRKQSIKEGVSAIVNKNNILITGDRGIGKSSFANQLLYISEGDKFLLDKLNINLPANRHLAHITISIRSLPGMTLNEIAGRIVREIVTKFELLKREEIEHEIDLKLYKFKKKFIDQKGKLEDVLDIFGYDLIKIIDALHTNDGLIILIDEVENIDPSTNFANFIKNISEYFISEERKINFILSGIPCATVDLFLQHPSFLRLFQPLELKEFSTIESYELIETYLGEYKREFANRAKVKICRIARGYPVNLQLIGFYTYQIDKDNYIDDRDIDFAIDYIIENIKKGEFISKHESIGFGLAESILKFALKGRKDGVVSYKELKNVFKDETEESIVTSLEKLTKKEVFSKYSKGNYYIKDHLFIRYLKKLYDISK